VIANQYNAIETFFIAILLLCIYH